MKNVNSCNNKETLNMKNDVSMPSTGEKAKAFMNGIATQMAPDSTFQSSEWNNLNVGSLVHLGMKKRPHNDHSITPYPVAWRVLEIDSEHNKALLISDKALDFYADDDKKDEKKNWEDTTLRLQHERLYHSLFSDADKEMILSSTSITDSVTNDSRESTNNTIRTEDYLFSLDVKEYQKYFTKAHVSGTCSIHPGVVSSVQPNVPVRWLLRNCGSIYAHISVDFNGNIDLNGHPLNWSSLSEMDNNHYHAYLRPAMWVELPNK